MVDFNINLVKSMTSTPEQRAKFYNRMLIYLVTCAALLVGASYVASRNVVDAVYANRERNALMDTMTAVYEYGVTLSHNPEQAYQEISDYADDLKMLRKALLERSKFLPVMSLLFSDFPANVGLQSLVASSENKTIEFELVAPVIDENGEDVLRKLQDNWRNNDELHMLAHPVTQQTSERQMVGDSMMVSVKYKCLVK